MQLIPGWRDYQPTQDFFADKTILLTGAASGIGRAVTLLLAQCGATVLMLDRKVRHLEKLFDQIEQQQLTQPVILPVDLLEITPQSATTLAQAIMDDFGKLDGIIHNAAELGSPSPLDQYDLDYWQQVMQTNFQAPYLLTRALLPLLRQDHQTSLIFSSAAIGRKPAAYGGAYSIFYAAAEAQMMIWADELEKVSNIRINSLDPGPTRTTLRRRSHPGESQDSLATPQTVAPAYLQLLENSSGWHGQQFALQAEVGNGD
jgi:NAD(P)-dependent dehydrogenase (short-subunit alcohol dehydrogenase family)